MSELELEQQTNITFLVKLENSDNEIRDMLVQVYGDSATKKTAVYKLTYIVELVPLIHVITA
jgi:cytochrome c-type biogenesis protein CcmH/NrfF